MPQPRVTGTVHPWLCTLLALAPLRSLHPNQPDQLGFLPLAEWQEGSEYDKYPPQYICYTIAWKLILNHKTVGRVTEEDLVVAPSEYWEGSLKASFEEMLQTKKKDHQQV